MSVLLTISTPGVLVLLLVPRLERLQDRLRDTVEGGGKVLEILTEDHGRPVRVSL